MTIAQQLNIKEFPVTIKDKNCNNIYWENCGFRFGFNFKVI
jgi:hypothetical protein